MFHIRHKWIAVSSCRYRVYSEYINESYLTRVLYRCSEYDKHKTKSING